MFRFIIYVSGIAFCLAWLVTGWMSMSSMPAFDLQPMAKPAKGKAERRTPDIGLIIKSNIFNVETSEEVVGAAEDAPIIASSGAAAFNAELVGVLSGGGRAMAVVSLNSKKYILKIGDEQDGLKLESVGFIDAVVSYQGKEYRLVLKEPDTDKASSPPRRVQSSTPAKGSESGTTSTLKISRKEVVENLSDVNQVIKSILIVPYERNGSFEGYRVRRMSGGSVLKKLGIQRNDVITRLNGKALDTPTVFFDTLKNAENVSSVTIDILRSGEKKSLFVEIEE